MGANSPMTLAIIGGKYKNKKILLPPKETTRSTKSILRESLFNTLQNDIVDAVFVEVFAGSGSVGLEALSRGAKESWFIEIDRESFRILEKNIAAVDSQNAHSVFGNSFEKIDSVISHLEKSGQKAYFYLDPPFQFREGMEDIYDKTVRLVDRIPELLCEMIVIEHMSGLKLPEKTAHYLRTKSKKFGKSTLSYYSAMNG